MRSLPYRYFNDLFILNNSLLLDVHLQGWMDKKRVSVIIMHKIKTEQGGILFSLPNFDWQIKYKWDKNSTIIFMKED